MGSASEAISIDLTVFAARTHHFHERSSTGSGRAANSIIMGQCTHSGELTRIHHGMIKNGNASNAENDRIAH